MRFCKYIHWDESHMPTECVVPADVAKLNYCTLCLTGMKIMALEKIAAELAYANGK